MNAFYKLAGSICVFLLASLPISGLYSRTDSIQPINHFSEGKDKRSDFAITGSAEQNICGGGTGVITAEAVGGKAPFRYNWSTGERTASIVQPAGTYTCIITDAENRKAQSVFTITERAKLQVHANVRSVSCAGMKDGSVQLNAAGGSAPYTYSLSGGRNERTINSLGAGTYEYVVCDAQGCETKGQFTITTPEPLTFALTSVTEAEKSFTCDGSAVVVGSGGTIPYKYSWSDGQQNANANHLCEGYYHVRITDANGCAADTIVEVTALHPAGNSPAMIAKKSGNPDDSAGFKFYFPNAFTPDNNNVNDLFTAYGNNIISFDLKIYDRKGTMIFETKDAEAGWNGKNTNGTTMQQGVYLYLAEVIDKDGKLHQYNGSVTLIR